MQLLEFVDTSRDNNRAKVYDIGTIKNDITKEFGIYPTEKNKKFLSNVSHNLKNPLGTLLGYSELLLSDYSELTTQERIDYVSEINKAASFTNRFTERFFEWIYYKTGKVEIQFESINLHSFVKEFIHDFVDNYQYSGEIKMNIDANTCVLVDLDSLSKIFFHLFENVINNLPQTKSSIIEINSARDNNYIKIEIKDNGQGIHESIIPKLFNISENLGLTINKTDGTGFGLILTDQLIKMNKGLIEINSMHGEGTSVCIKLLRGCK